MGDPAFGQNRRCLDHDCAEAAVHKAAQMHQMPSVGDPVLRSILAHRRNRASVGKHGVADLKG